MKNEPSNHLSPKSLHVWRIYGAIQVAIAALLAAGGMVLTYFLKGEFWIYAVLAAVVLLLAYFVVYLFPKIRYSRWRYEVRDQEIEVQHGLFVMKRTLVPMVRVQHVDIEQGPILRLYNLASISISTAATDHSIPMLVTEEANELRQRISILARVIEDDL
ncbi:PH domain-containing protein [Paenisporosarcina cavernae]|uniref:YdbS-like PH domain-containing protein n=1 Tax=Paenisporosarcina cavernae TaxID=2320858 RepID=A0A385YU31_9BACL|nr:PH domain-containing protein [Paenisporosarcina cavernae]AYC30369.1 hypothetical protein D3873_11190 [Paenisporosarcina cavernae]